jgi:hypothetical protein
MISTAPELGPRFVDLVDDGSTNAALEELV